MQTVHPDQVEEAASCSTVQTLSVASACGEVGASTAMGPLPSGFDVGTMTTDGRTRHERRLRLEVVGTEGVSVTDRELVLRSFERLLGRARTETLGSFMPEEPWAEVVPPDVWLQREVLERMDEPRRRALHARLTEVLGSEAADAAMRFLPPVRWRVLQEVGVAHLLR